ncbi:MAG: hypothetical protein LBJ19_01440 [Holosporaceae bacterium]|nr:hypothetical protein [Holosporaceae bacterium]
MIHRFGYFLKAIALVISVFSMCCASVTDISTDQPDENEQKCHEYTLNNGVKVLLHEDFSMPVVVVSIVFHVGFRDCRIHQCGIPEIIADNLVSTRLHRCFSDLGIVYSTNNSYECTSLTARMQPKYIKNFFDLVGEFIRGVSLENFEICKKRLIIANKLDAIDPSWIVNSSIIFSVALANGIPNYLPNNSAIDATTETDVLEFFREKYRDCPLSIVITGAISSKILMKALQSSIGKLADRKFLSVWENGAAEAKELSSGNSRDSSFRKNFGSAKTITRHLRQISTSVAYCHNIPTNGSSDDDTKFADVFLHVFLSEAAIALVKTRLVERLYSQYYSPNTLVIRLLPKIYDGVRDLERNYEYFLSTMCSKNFSQEFLTKTSKAWGIDKLRMFCDLLRTNKQLVINHVQGKDTQSIYTLEERIKDADPKLINSFARRYFLQNL